MKSQVIYANGRYRVVPLVTLLVVEIEGRRLQTFGVEEIDLAVRTVDEMAESEGCYAAVG